MHISEPIDGRSRDTSGEDELTSNQQRDDVDDELLQRIERIEEKMVTEEDVRRHVNETQTANVASGDGGDNGSETDASDYTDGTIGGDL